MGLGGTNDFVEHFWRSVNREAARVAVYNYGLLFARPCTALPAIQRDT